MRARAPTPVWQGTESDSPVIAVAVHAGHLLRDEIAGVMALDEETRRREEDFATEGWADLAPTRLIATRSRFEADLNRPRETAVYLTAEDAWGLDVWKEPLAKDVVERSLAGYDAFYTVLQGVLDRAERAFGRFVVYDLHSYNHRRGGPDAEPADPAGHPDVNVGTGSMDRARWGSLVDRFIGDLRNVTVPWGTGRLDVRENVCFQGRQIAAFVHERYPTTGCALAIEIKKFYMDEHTGVLDPDVHAGVGAALAATVPGVLAELGRAEA